MSGKPKLQRHYADFLRSSRENPEDLPAYYRLYHDCNSYVDYEIGRVLDALRELLPEDNALVIYTSDHGDHHGAFGLCAKGPTLYDATCAVPLMVKAPGAVPGRRVGGLASGVDIFPTILDFAGIDRTRFKPQNGYDGASLLPAVRGEADAAPHDAVFMEYHRFGINQDQTDGATPTPSASSPPMPRRRSLAPASSSMAA